MPKTPPEPAITTEANGLCECNKCHAQVYGITCIPCYNAWHDGEEYWLELCHDCLSKLYTESLIAGMDRRGRVLGIMQNRP